MKKIFLIVVLVLCLALCACSGGNDTTKEPDTSTEMGLIETDHPLLAYLFGTWKLQNEEDAEKNPYWVREITISVLVYGQTPLTAPLLNKKVQQG